MGVDALRLRSKTVQLVFTVTDGDLEPPKGALMPSAISAVHLFQEVSGHEKLLRYSLAVLGVGEVFPCCMMLL
jgi:hypothetical protein